MVHIAEHRGFIAIAGAVEAFAAAQQRGAFGQRIGHLGIQQVQLRRAGDGADVGVVGHRVADLEALHRLHKTRDKLVVNSGMYINALDRAAALAGVVHGTIGQGLGGVLDGRVVTHIGRVFAAQFELHLDHARPQDARNARTGGVGAGEKQAIDGLRHQRGTHRTAAHQRDEHVLRHTGLMQQARHLQAAQGGVFGGLVQHHVAGQQRGNKDIATHKPGVIPGRDVGHQA